MHQIRFLNSISNCWTHWPRKFQQIKIHFDIRCFHANNSVFCQRNKSDGESITNKRYLLLYSMNLDNAPETPKFHNISAIFQLFRQTFRFLFYLLLCHLGTFFVDQQYFVNSRYVNTSIKVKQRIKKCTDISFQRKISLQKEVVKKY